MSLESERYLLATQHDGDSDQKGSQRQAVANCVQETKLVPVGLSKKKKKIHCTTVLLYCHKTDALYHCTILYRCTTVLLYHCITLFDSLVQLVTQYLYIHVPMHIF